MANDEYFVIKLKSRKLKEKNVIQYKISMKQNTKTTSFKFSVLNFQFKLLLTITLVFVAIVSVFAINFNKNPAYARIVPEMIFVRANLFAENLQDVVFIETTIMHTENELFGYIRENESFRLRPSEREFVYNANVWGLNNFTIAYHSASGLVSYSPGHFPIEFDRLERLHAAIHTLNPSDYTENAWQNVLSSIRAFEVYSVLQTATTQETARLYREVLNAIAGEITIARVLVAVPVGLSADIRFYAESSATGLLKGAEATFVIGNASRNAAQITSINNLIKVIADKPYAYAFNFGVNLREGTATGQIINLVGTGALYIRLPNHTTSATLFFSPTGEAVSLIENTRIQNGFLVAEVDRLGDFFILVEINHPRYTNGFFIGDRFYPFSIFFGVIGGVVGLIIITVVAVILVNKRRKN